MRSILMKTKLILLGGTSLLLTGSYLAGNNYYEDRFIPNTRLAAFDISHLSPVSAQDKISHELANTTITLTENGQAAAEFAITPDNAQLKLDDALFQAHDKQDSSEWFRHYFDYNEVESLSDDWLSIDPQALESALKEQGFDNEDRSAAQNAYIAYEESQGYYPVPGERGEQIDYTLLASEISHNLRENQVEVDLSQAYIMPELTSESSDITARLEKFNALNDIEINLLIAEEEYTIPSDLIADWVEFNSDSQSVIYNEEAIYEFVTDLHYEHNTFSKTRDFISTNQGTVQVPPGILGWGIDIDQEVANIISDLEAGVDVRREPAVYSTGGIANAKDDIGNSHVEIDLAYQMMYLYIDGNLILSTPIVSGQPGAETIPGANAVNEMLYDTDLVGYNHISGQSYSTPVTFWIRFDDQAQGIHNAPWQSQYGGDVHLTAGSLGCINTPYDAAQVIWDYVDYGFPVIVF